MSRRLGLELRETQQMIKHKIAKDRMKHPFQLTHNQIRILHFILEKEEAVYQKDIEEFLHIRRSTATEMLNALERNGHIKRVRAKHDARLKEIVISEEALEAFEEMDKYIDNLEKMLQKDIAQEDLDVFFKVLKQVQDNIK